MTLFFHFGVDKINRMKESALKEKWFGNDVVKGTY